MNNGRGVTSTHNVFVEELLSKTLNSPINLSTELELREQVVCAINAFSAADVDRTGHLTVDELGELCDNMGMKIDKNIHNNFVAIASEGSLMGSGKSQVGLNEWLEWWLGRVSQQPNPSKQREIIARNTFQKFDRDGNGSLDVCELSSVLNSLGADFTDEEMTSVLRELDVDNNDKINMNEFIDWWCDRVKTIRQSNSIISMKLK